MIKVGDRIIYNRTKARGVVVDMVIQTPPANQSVKNVLEKSNIYII